MSKAFDNTAFPGGFFPDRFWPEGFWPEPPSSAEHIEQALYELVLEDTAVVALIADRLYPLNLPPGQRQAAIVFQQIAEREPVTTDGALGLIDARFQFNCFASSHAGSRALTAALREALSDYEGTIGEVTIAQIRIDDEKEIPVLDEQAEQLSRFGRFLDGIVSYST